MEITKDDYVVRLSYNCDVIFKVIDINQCSLNIFDIDVPFCFLSLLVCSFEIL